MFISSHYPFQVRIGSKKAAEVAKEAVVFDKMR